MESKKFVTVSQAKEIDMVGYLAKLGFIPKYIKGTSHWYLSPLRPDEKTPSFKVDSKLNRWYDHGEGKGGNLVDFGIQYYKSDVRTFLLELGESGSINIPAQVQDYLPAGIETQEKITISEVKPLRSPALYSYLHHRGIVGALAKQYYQEVNYLYKERTYYAIGFRNNEGGFELRNAYAKLSSSPKAITTFLGGHKSIAVFEGSPDFLSYLTLQQQMGWKDHDYLILNSTSFLEQARELIGSYSEKWLFFDNDPTGQKCRDSLMKSGTGFTDMSPAYSSSKDLNEWLVNVKLKRSNKLPPPKTGQSKKAPKR